MKVRFGTDSATLKSGQNAPVVWDSSRVINGHMLIMGKSGTGKTYTLKKILDQMQEQSQKGVRVHIMDVHGDIEVPGASTVKFSESTQYGFNPLMINPDPDFGGVRKKIQSFLAALNRTQMKLGSKQEAVLRNILIDLYAANGFYEGQPKSWLLNDGVTRKFPKKYPTLGDAAKFANYKLKSMFLGTNSKAVGALEAVNRKVSQFYVKQKNLHKSFSDLDKKAMEDDIKRTVEEAQELYNNYLNSIQTGMELTDLIKYDSKEVMKSVVERLENLNAIGIFKPEAPPFDPRCNIWRYDIRALSVDEKKLFVSFMLEAIFLLCVQRGVQDEIREIIVLDEAHNFFNDEPDNITNVISKEARKFGTAMICASQSPTHFSDDFVANVGTKIILGLDQMFWDGSVRKLKLDLAALEWIVPHYKMLIQINNKAELKNRFIWTMLDR